MSLAVAHDSARPLAPADVRRAVANLLVDQTTIRISRAFAAAAIEHILLKGPVIADWLYDEDEVRGYDDSDLLVAMRDWDRAVGVLSLMGFRERLAPMRHPRMEGIRSDAWCSDEPAEADVDLHATLDGLEADPAVVWRALWEGRAEHSVAGRSIAVLGAGARTLHVALHAAQHRDGRALADLGRAVERVGVETWASAADLADRLGGRAALNAGLSLTDPGRALARRIGVADARSMRTAVRAADVPLAAGLYELATTRGFANRASMLGRELFPTAEFLRWWSPTARRGRLGLAAARVWRPAYLVVRLPRAAIAVRSARRGTPSFRAHGD